MGYISNDKSKEIHLEVVMGPEPKKEEPVKSEHGEINFTQSIRAIAKTMKGEMLYE